jgi:hypothetical protein
MAAADAICALCSTESQQGQPLAELPCKHRVHTQCLIHVILNDADAECPRCDTVIKPKPAPQVKPVPKNSIELWEENEDFRKEILTYKKSIKEYLSIYEDYHEKFKVIEKRYKDNIAPSLEMIKEQKRQGIESVKNIPSRNKLLGKVAAFRRARSALRKYGVNLYELNAVPGAPNFRYDKRLEFWRLSVKSIFE